MTLGSMDNEPKMGSISNWVWPASIGAVVIAMVALWVLGVFDIAPVAPVQ